MRHRVFVGFADIKEDTVKSLGEDLAEFEGADFREFGHGTGIVFVSDRGGNGAFGTAKRTGGIGFDLNLAEAGGQGAVVDEASQRRLAQTSEQLDRFHRLKGADDAGEDSQDPGFSATGHCSGRRRLREEAAVTRAAKMGSENRDLSFKLEDGPVNQGLFEEEGRIVGGEAGREIVRTVEDGIVSREEIERIFGGETPGMNDEFDVRIDLMEVGAGALQFGLAHPIGRVEDLAVEIGQVHDVRVDQADAADSGSGEVNEGG